MFVKLEEVFGEAPNSLNEAVDRKDIFKEFTKTTMLEVGRGSKLSRGNSGVVELDGYAAASIKYGWFKRGNAYGDFEVLNVTPVNQQDFEASVRLGEKKYTLYLKNTGSDHVSTNVAKKIAEQIFDNSRLFSSAKISTVGNYLVIDVDSKIYSNLKAVRLGHTYGKRFGDIIVTDNGKKPSGITDGDPFIMEVVTEDGIAELVFRDADKLSDMNESLKDELDFGKAIMKHLGIKGKQIGRTNVFEVSGRDRMKIDKLKENDELGEIIIFGVEDDAYSTNLEVKTYFMPKTLTVKFTDEAEMFESVQFADLNAIDNKTIKDVVKATFKALGTKVGRDASVYQNNIEVTTPLITTTKLETGAVKMGTYGDVKLVNYEEGKSGKSDRLIVEYKGDLYPIALQVYEGYATLRFPKSQDLLNKIGKQYHVDVSNADGNPYVKGDALVRLSDKDFKKLQQSIKVGDMLDDNVIAGVSDVDQETRLFRGAGVSVTVVTPKHQAGFAFLPESAVAGLHESTVELNEVTGLPKHKTLVPSHLI